MKLRLRKWEVAEQLSVHETSVMRKAKADGRFPQPHYDPGSSVPFWFADDVDRYIASLKAQAEAAARARAKAREAEDVKAATTVAPTPPVKRERAREPLLDRPVTDLALTERARRCLTDAGILTIGALVQKTEKQLMELRHFGVGSLDVVCRELQRRNLHLGMNAFDRQPAEEVVA